MPRKGRLVQPRHIFPWIAAPYIEMLRILWRIESFFFLPIRYLQAWTVSAIFGVFGVLFSVALFIPNLTKAHAAPGASRPVFFERDDMPFIPDDQLVLPAGDAADSAQLSVELERTYIEDRQGNRITQSELDQRITTHSQVVPPKKSSLPQRDAWTRFLQRPVEHDEHPIQSYVQRARVRDAQLAPEIPDYAYDPGVTGSRDLTQKSPTLLIEKYVPKVHSPDEPLTYAITLTNNGSEPVEWTLVEEYLSDIHRVIDCDPPAMVTSQNGHLHLVWEQAELLPSETREMRVTIQPDKQRAIIEDTLVSFTSAPVIAETLVRETQRDLPADPDQEPVVPEVISEPVVRPAASGHPQLVIRFDPPQTVKVGEELQAYYTVENIGTADATGIRLLVEVPPQLRHRFGELVEHKISRLAPNETRRALFAALAEGAGRLPLHWTLEANDLETQSDSEWLAVLSRPIPSRSPVRSSVPAISSIPSTEPTPVDEEILPTPFENSDNRTAPRIDETLPENPVAEPRPQVDPTSVPAWTAPDTGDEVTPDDDWKASTPLVPELTPEELPWKSSIPGITPPVDLLPLKSEPSSIPSSIPSTIPPESLPSEETDGVKAQ